MIGVACQTGQEPIVEEFFEFFKTPWEFYRPDRAYPVLVSTRGPLEDSQAQIVILYGSASSDEFAGELPDCSTEGRLVDCGDVRIPIYGKLLTFGCDCEPLVRLHGSSVAVAFESASSPVKVLCVGYDLFEEVRFLLSRGQTLRNALSPTLEIHASMLRNWILAAGIPVVEIPSVPAGYDFITCLTHDVDFVRIKDHKLDHTMLGFIQRASVGSLRQLARGEMSWRHFAENIKALLSLPAVLLGISKDFWFQDFDRFLELERGLKATFFFIPFRNRPGDKVSRPHSKRRAAAYDVTKERKLLLGLKTAGNEIGVHGIDAWHSADKGREERRRIAETAGSSSVGVRMHWLCFDPSSPRLLEEAGFQYDSTVGYNETVGYRAGTLQVFRPWGASTLLELPLHIQDTALFYKGHLGLTKDRAWKLCEVLVNNAARYGGVLTVVWHTRSLAPERLWGDFYARLLETIKTHRVWFGTAGQVVEWFRARRALSFQHVEFTKEHVRVAIGHEGPDKPNLVLRIHAPNKSVRDIPWTGEPLMEIPVGWMRRI
ncbi:MAG TPA: hypothetical protein VE422_29245 [Terriglobia bacterium]|nr:hypothetical protein [Terriglobia bacterium]